MRSVRQAGGTQLSDIQDFLLSEQMPIVVKPVESAGSDGVKLCHTKQEAEEHLHLLLNSQQKGKGYVVDHVSRDSEHKTTMIWV